LLFVAGDAAALEPVRKRVAGDPALARSELDITRFPRTIEPTTDDWPYFYLKEPGVPKYFLLVGGAVLVLAFMWRRRLFRAGERIEVPMLLLGAGFMLLEISGVSRASLLYGTTWEVNAIVVGAILAMTLLANLVASRSRIDPFGLPLFGLIAA